MQKHPPICNLHVYFPVLHRQTHQIFLVSKEMHRLFQQPKTKNPNSCSSENSVAQTPLDFLGEAVFAGDSFWKLESAFGNVDGVVKTATGYCGGTLRKPTYREVIEGGTAHTEAVKVVFDKRKISYRFLCNVFWESHDSTNKDYLRFGVDTHYRSVIFYATEDQKKQAQESKIKHQMKLNKRIVTKILPYSSDFFLAENQHQKHYLQNNYIRVCESLSLRSTEQFVDSHMACRLNGILAQQGNVAVENMKRFMKSCEMPTQTKVVLEGIVEDLEQI